MAMISCYVDERTLHILQRESTVRHESVETLASRAIEAVAISTLPGGYPVSGFEGQHFITPIHQSTVERGRMGLGEMSKSSTEFPE